MRKFLVFTTVAILLLATTGAFNPRPVVAEKIPAECFVSYAVWAGPYCDVFILCFVFQACSTTPNPEGDADGVSGKPKNAVNIDRSDSGSTGE